MVVDDPGLPLIVRPRDSLGRTWMLAVVIAGVPFFGVLYWLASQNGSWRQVVVFQVLGLGIAAFVWIRHNGAYAQVTETAIEKQAFFVRRSVDRADVASVVLVDTWRPGVSEATREMLLKNAEGHTILRLRGTFWSADAQEALAHALGVPVLHDTTPVTSKEFLAAHPGAAYWYEDKAWVAVAGISVAFATAFLLMSWIMHAIGSPSALHL